MTAMIPPVRSILMIYPGYYASIGGAETVNTALANYFRLQGIDVKQVGYNLDLAESDPRQSAAGYVPLNVSRDDRTLGEQSPKIKSGVRARFKTRLRSVPGMLGIHRAMRNQLSFFRATKDLPVRKSAGLDGLLREQEFPLAVICIAPETAMYVSNARDRLGLSFPILELHHSIPKIYLADRGRRRVLKKLARTGELDLLVVLHGDYIAPYRQIGLEKVVAIGNPAPQVSPVAHLERSSANEIAIMGRLVDVKNVQDAVRTWQKVAPLRPGWCLKIYGSGPEKEPMQALISRLNLDANIQLMGDTSTPLEALRESELLLLTSKWESWSMVIVEAASVSTPTIAYDCSPGVRELVKSGETGVLVPPGNRAALADAILWLTGDESTRKAMGAAAYRNIQKYSIESIGKRWLEAIEGLVEGRSESRGS